MSTEPIFAEERQNRILSMLKVKNKLLVNELCELFAVSPATIRNDLNYLEKQGLLKRTHGGAISGAKAGFEPTSLQKLETNRDEKQRIAVRAAEMIDNGDTVAIDTGTTTYYLAEQLVGKRDVTIVTPDIRIATLLEGFPGITVILVGGTLRKGFSCTIGSIANQMLSALHVDKVFLATNAVTPLGELCTPDIEQSQVKKTLLGMGGQTILICDSSKFGAHSFAKFGMLTEIDVLITDSNIDRTVLTQLRERDLSLEIV